MAITSLILLGNYRTSPIYVYTIDGNNFYSIEDMNCLFLNQRLNTKAVIIKQLFLSNPNHFVKENETIYINTNTMITIARLFNMYHLAELCKLTNEEILGGVADPLLNTIAIDGWKKCVMTVVVERDLVFQSLNGDEWLFIAPPIVEKDTKCHSVVVAPVVAVPEPVHSFSTSQEMLYHWLSSNINTNSHNIIQTLISAAKVKKQQQAIIETRQRQIAFVIPMNNKSTNNTKKQKSHSTNTSATTTTYHQRKKNTAGIIQYNNHDTSLPPSPPTISHYTTSSTRKRKSQNQTTVIKNKKAKTLSLLPPPPTSTTTSATYQQYTTYHGNDNLNLLATQATQMRGLPISPEVSPSPPPFYHQHRLPSIQVMLSELNHNHYYRSHGNHS